MTADVEEYLPDYEFAFEDTSAEGAGMYYRCSRTHDLQSEFGDMQHRIHDLEVPCSFPFLALTWRMAGMATPSNSGQRSPSPFGDNREMPRMPRSDHISTGQILENPLGPI